MNEVQKRTIEIPFALGEEVWRVDTYGEEKWETCPDCAGNRTIIMIQGNGEQAIIACAGCRNGYEPSRGVVCSRNVNFTPKPYTCANISIGYQGKFTYDGHYAENLYRTREEAEAACAVRLKEHEDYLKQIIINNVSSKRRDMAWSVHYWSRKVKELERELEAARERLGLSKEKAKNVDQKDNS